MDEPDKHPLGDEPRLAGDDGVEQREIRVVGVGGGGIVLGDGMIGEPTQNVEFACGRDVFEAADTQVACGDPGKDGAVEHRLALHLAAGGDDGKGARGRDAAGRASLR